MKAKHFFSKIKKFFLFLMQNFLLVIVLFYKKIISPCVGSCCRFFPSCSTYCFLSIKKHGPIKGTMFSLKRLVKCGPWHKGGVDPVPDVSIEEFLDAPLEKG